MHRTPRTRRITSLAAGVVLFHLALLWLLQNGLRPPPAASIVPVTLYATTPKLPAAPPRSSAVPRQAVPPPQHPQAEPPAFHEPVPAPVQPPLPAASEPEAAETVTDSAAETPSPPTPSQATDATQIAPAPSPATPVPAPVQPPDSSARYLNNPQPAYPALSQRLGEQGRVVVRVLIGPDGRARQAEILHSSGFPRLDRAALQTVQNWRYVAGKRGGIPEAMWHNVPIDFILQ
ncbi:MAG: energy transducer TonB [Hylemonella sp.]|nr:energy transducer TonB [Hylemonella sp.]